MTDTHAPDHDPFEECPIADIPDDEYGCAGCGLPLVSMLAFWALIAWMVFA